MRLTRRLRFPRALIPLAFLPCLSAPVLSEDIVSLKDGSSQAGMVVDLGGNRVELVLKGGAKTILKRDISKVTLDEKRERKSIETSDAIVKRDGHIVRGKVEVLEGGQKVQVSLPGGGRAVFNMKDVRRVVRSGDSVELDATVYTLELGKAVEAALDRLVRSDDPAGEAEKLLGRCGILAIARVREARKAATRGSPGELALARIERLHRLKEVVSTDMEEAESRIYDVLDHGSTQEKLDLLALVFPRFVDASARLAELLATDSVEDPKVKAWSIDFLRRMRRNRELLRIYARGSGQSQLAAAIALAQNRIQIGVPSMIEALELEALDIRDLASRSLRESTGQDFQFRPDGAPQARKEAVERWRAWWQENEEALTRAAERLVQGADPAEAAGGDALDPERVLAVKLWEEAGAEVGAGRFKEAEGLLREAVDRDPTFLQAHIGLAVVLYSQLGRPADAAALLKEIATKRFPGVKRQDRQWIFLHRGHALRLAGDLAGAEAAYEECRSIAPQNHQALIGLGDLAFHGASSAEGVEPAQRKAKLKLAVDAYRAALRVLDGLTGELVTLRGDAVPTGGSLPFDRREYNRSVLDLRKSYRTEKHDVSLKVSKALSLAGEKKEAMVVLKGLVDDLAFDGSGASRKLEAGARCYMGLLYEDLGQPVFALREYRKVLKDLDASHAECLRGVDRVRRQTQSGGDRSSN
ncbi:MAG: tetratricopeptide repeat protein [Planctomycetes bacterium]|nr:tetratricopeptide repeat protein [Planctomycetota bacterium]